MESEIRAGWWWHLGSCGTGGAGGAGGAGGGTLQLLTTVIVTGLD